MLTRKQIALDTFIENVATLGIEQCLLNHLANLIPPNKVHSMDDEMIAELAAEPPEIEQERSKAEAQAAALEDVIRICEGYARREPGMGDIVIAALCASARDPVGG